MSTGPCSAAKNPRDYIEEVFHGLPEAAASKILHDNAARIYRVD
jgi:predicted TIM-barrel fold metal-dependent hydrolase